MIKNHTNKIRDEGPNFLYEFLSVFGNGTTADELARCLGRRRETVQREVIGVYQKRFPGVLEYDSRTHQTRLSHGAALKFCPTTPSAITAIASVDQIKANFDIGPSLFAAPVEDIGIVSDLFPESDCEALDSDPFRCLFAALMRKQAVHLDYFAKTGRSSFSFSPHALVRTSFRLHFRGFSDMHDGRPGIYIDIIAERVARADFLGTEAYTGAEGDADWKRKVRVIAELRDDLPEPLLRALQQEFNLKPGDRQETRPARYALAEYVKEALVARRVRGWDGPVWRAEVEADADDQDRHQSAGSNL